ncbi:MAG: PadR family transcriptional regulator [Rhodospirillales bacterium]|nr:PadR family transcriptional regulator [Alphaproteobacteria bacterium]MCB1839490.1 PadR family transcriptional regulator [Alphaproteobacteria bacterium]MCB9977514.1 PadR family transcriptional regulator [Rhodospirillales bacterium]
MSELSVDSWIAQIRKGLVELCVLAILSRGEAYGYSILKQLEEYPGLAFKESTLYLVLGRLKKEGLVSVRTGPSESGPPRRYFKLTATGKRRLHDMRHYWEDTNKAIIRLLEQVED